MTADYSFAWVLAVVTVAVFFEGYSFCASNWLFISAFDSSVSNFSTTVTISFYSSLNLFFVITYKPGI